MEPKQSNLTHHDVATNKRQNFKIISMVVICIIVLSTLSIYILYKNEENASITNVRINPEFPQPGDKIEIHVYTNENMFFHRPRITFNVLSYNIEKPLAGRSFQMTKSGERTYVTTIGTFDEDVQIWYMITLPTSTNLHYNESTIDVGNIQYSDDVLISDVDYSPKHLHNCSSIQISANFTHEGVISQPTQMISLYHVFYPNGYSSSGSGTLMGDFNSSTGITEYSFIISSYQDYFPPNAIVFYRLFFLGDDYRYLTPSYQISIL